MLVTFYSNYLTHHQIPICEELYKMDNVQFFFVSTIPMSQDRISGGWKQEGVHPYEIRTYESKDMKQLAEKLATESDVMIIGSAPEEYVWIRMKLGKNKVTLRYCERIYKGGYWRVLSPRGIWNRFQTYFKYHCKDLYMLCASNYTAGDLALLGSYWNRCFKWGYFPETKKYDSLESLMDSKKKMSILWAGRFLELKHPEAAIEIAISLKKQGIIFTLTMVGSGPMSDQILKMVRDNCLEDCVVLTGAVPHQKVREYMENSEVFLFTSDKHEGWGAVLNEAMNSACAVIASKKIGSVGFLIDDGIDGLVYDGNNQTLEYQVMRLINDYEMRRKLGIAAYQKIIGEWSAETAAVRLVKTCERLLNNEKVFFDEGPCSEARRVFG